MTSVTSDYWMTYLRHHTAQEDREYLQKETVKENAKRVIEISERERDELRDALLCCNSETRIWTSRLLALPHAYKTLYSVLDEEKTNHTRDDAFSRFASRLEEDETLRQRINERFDLIENTAEQVQSNYEMIRQSANKTSTHDDIRKDLIQRQKRTWKDLPEDELAERLSKGEIIGRDEWIPGLNNDRRKLQPNELAIHLEFGKKLHIEGNEAFSGNDFNLALTRYSQGVNLLNWVEGTSPEEKKQVDNLFVMFLRNQAAAALELHEYRIADEACTTALGIDPYDSKARYRRARAAICLGNLAAAKKDFLTMIKSPYPEPGSILSAKQGLRDIRQIVSKWKTDIKDIVTSATAQDTFSTNRDESYSQQSDKNQDDSHNNYQNWSASQLPLRLKSNTYVVSPTTMNPPLNECPPFLSLEETQKLLENILELYTDDDVQTQLNQLRRDADFDERRVLIRAKKLLPALLGSLLNEWNIPGDTFNDKKKAMEKCIVYWRCRDPVVKSLAEDVYKSFLGDVIEE